MDNDFIVIVRLLHPGHCSLGSPRSRFHDGDYCARHLFRSILQFIPVESGRGWGGRKQSWVERIDLYWRPQHISGEFWGQGRWDFISLTWLIFESTHHKGVASQSRLEFKNSSWDNPPSVFISEGNLGTAIPVTVEINSLFLQGNLSNTTAFHKGTSYVFVVVAFGCQSKWIKSYKVAKMTLNQVEYAP
jgi:hypothetical protein